MSRPNLIAVRLSNAELTLLHELTGKGQTQSAVVRRGIFVLAEKGKWRRSGGTEKKAEAQAETGT